MGDSMKDRQTTKNQGYQVQDSELTLRQALQAFRTESDVVPVMTELSGRGLGGKLQAHDVSHVLFGCPSTVEGEIVLARWNLFGATDFGQIYGRGLMQPEGRELFRKAFHKARPRDFTRGIVRGFVAVYRALRMTRRWPTFEYERYLDQRLVEIRCEFGIQLV